MTSIFLNFADVVENYLLYSRNLMTSNSINSNSINSLLNFISLNYLPLKYQLHIRADYPIVIWGQNHHHWNTVRFLKPLINCLLIIFWHVCFQSLGGSIQYSVHNDQSSRQETLRLLYGMRSGDMSDTEQSNSAATVRNGWSTTDLSNYFCTR